MKEKSVAAIIILSPNHEILLQNRAKNRKFWENRSFFWGGIETKETPQDAAIREAHEELWLKLSKSNLIFLWSISHEITKNNEKIRYHRHLFAHHTKKFTDFEGSGAHFFEISKILDLKFNTPIQKEFALIKKHLAKQAS